MLLFLEQLQEAVLLEVVEVVVDLLLSYTRYECLEAQVFRMQEVYEAQEMYLDTSDIVQVQQTVEALYTISVSYDLEVITAQPQVETVETVDLSLKISLIYKIMFCYIKNWKLEATSEELIENGQWVSYDEVIETKLEWRVEYIDWEIFQYEEPEIVYEETPEQFRQRKIWEFIASKKIEDFEWEWVEITQDDYSRLIILRDFEWDSWAQQAMLAKTDMKHIYMFKSLWVPLDTLKVVYAEEIAKLEEISKTKQALWLNPFDLSFLYESETPQE